VEAPLEGEKADVPLRSTVQPDEVHSEILTSGTTGAPTEVGLTYGNHHASATASAERLGLEPGDRWLCPLPLFHVGGLAILLRSVICGSTAVLHDGFDAGRVRGALEEGEATFVSLVPTMLARLRDAGLRSAPALKAALLGGGPIPEELFADPRLPVVATYGMTETASHVATRAPGDAGARPLHGVELAIGEKGEVLVRGPMVAPGAFGPDGWLHTGDRGRVEEGLLHVEGRLKEVIVTGGENVSPVEVEGVLVAHPAVKDAAVVAVPDAEWGEAVTAFVVLGAPADAEELIDWCRERLAGYKVPKRVEQVPALPRNPAGKLLRDEIVP
jgi:O-succinylbenzoic acid--CoA ligase